MACYWPLLEPWLEQAAGYARSILRNRHDAEDAVQQAVLRGLERFSSYDGTRPFKGWWFAILRNGCIDLLRSRRSRATVALEPHDPPARPAAPAGGWEALADAIGRLTPDHQEILRLRYFAELSYQELAEAVNIPAGTVMSRLHAARKSLAAHYPKERS